MPAEEQWRKLESLAGEGALFVWEAEPEAAIAARMSEAGIPFVVIDPAANAGREDWLTVQRANVGRLRAIP